MKKNVFLPALALAVTLTGSAGVLDLQSRMRLHQLKIEQGNAEVSKKMSKIRARGAAPAVASEGTTLAFVSLADGFTTADLEADGMKVIAMRGGIAVVSLPLADVEQMAASRAVRTMSLERPVKMHLDLAKKSTGIDVIHSGGDNLPQAYTGKGVFAAVVDQGIDPHHINFLDEDGNSRVEFIAHSSLNRVGQLTTKLYGNDLADGVGSAISDFDTDATDQYHGTHTLGILGGGYTGEIEQCEGLNGYTPIINKKANPFTGVATGANPGVACGELTDAGIATGLAYLLSYSVDYKHQPTVVNMSLGSNIGPHDKNSMMAQFLSEMGKDAIICVSAGNEGDMKIHTHKTFTSADKTVKTFIKPYYQVYDPEGDAADPYNTSVRYGQIVFYSNDATPFTLQAALYRKERQYRAASRFPISSSDGSAMEYASSTDYGDNVTTDVNFLNNFEGFIIGGTMLDEETNRYYGVIQYYLVNIGDGRADADGDEPFLWGFEVSGTEGQRVDVYCDGTTTYLDNYGVAGFDDGSRNGSISDLAVGDNILTVGAYSTRQEWQSLDGTVSAYPGDAFKPGFITEFSSFGTLADGTNLPHVCAPGSTVISSVSNPYLDYAVEALAAQTGVKLTDEMRKEYFNYMCQVRSTVDGKTYYWKQEPGTSMSTPLVAGTIALWLEADPTLTIDDVKDIVATTATVDDAVKAGDPVQWGAGKFNALEGLKEVIRRSAGIEGVVSDSTNDRLIVTPLGSGRFNIFAGDANGLDVALYAMNGAKVMAATAAGDEMTLDASGVASGIYVLQVNGHTQKLVVK